MKYVNIIECDEMSSVIKSLEEEHSEHKLNITVVNGFGGVVQPTYIDDLLVLNEDVLDVCVVIFGYCGMDMEVGGHNAYPIDTSERGLRSLPLDSKLVIHNKRRVPEHMYGETHRFKSPMSGATIGQSLRSTVGTPIIYLHYNFLNVVLNEYAQEALRYTIGCGLTSVNSDTFSLPEFNSDLTKPFEDNEMASNSKVFIEKITKGAIEAVESSVQQIAAFQDRIRHETIVRMEAIARLKTFGLTSIDGNPSIDPLINAIMKVRERDDVQWCIIDGNQLVLLTTDMYIDIDDDDSDYFNNEERCEPNPNEGREVLYDGDGDPMHDEEGDYMYADGEPHIEYDGEDNIQYIESGKIHVGKLLIEINISEGGSVVMHNITRHEIGYSGSFASHPHDMGNGRMCLGELDGVLPQLIAEFDFDTVVDLIINYAQSVNVHDIAGMSIGNWS